MESKKLNGNILKINNISYPISHLLARENTAKL
jgi:hypothetical protein